MNNKDRQEIKKLANNIGSLFRKFCKENCSDCPEADDSYNWTKERGCCANCGKTNGYFSIFTDKERLQLKNLKKEYGFTKEAGFFSDKKKSCNLPRWKRSRICLEYCCDWERGEFANKHTSKIAEIRENNGELV